MGDGAVVRSFQVDLRGVVDLLSHHLYSSPRVYLRELMQNAVDAITARRSIDGLDPAPVQITTAPGYLTVADAGVGLTEAEVHTLLATIGRSGKRDEFGYARHDFLGQFGIGLLSAFLVADEIVVDTRSVTGGPAVRWTGRSDGTYEIAAGSRGEAGTTVTLTARRGAETWLDPATVADLATLFGSLLPYRFDVDGRAVGGVGRPWVDAAPADLHRLSEQTFGFRPFDAIHLRVPGAGLSGVAYVMPMAANPAVKAGHRVYLKGMLLTESAPGLLPDWAFFVRCIVDAEELRPTASREGLYEDALLEETREALGDAVRGWLVGLAHTDPGRLYRFLRIHHVGVKAMAMHDDEMLRMVYQWWPVATNVGQMTLEEFHGRYGVLRYTSTTEDFSQLGAVAAAAGVPVINGGYTYDSDLIERLPEVDPSLTAARLDPTELATRFETLDPGLELQLRPVLMAAQSVMDRLGCEVVIRTFEPAGLPALYLLDREAAFQADLRATRAKADDLWAGVLSSFESGAADHRPQLVLNHRNPLVRRVCGLAGGPALATAIEAIYGQSLLLGQHPLRPDDAVLLNRSLLDLLELAMPNLDGTA